ncbi:hypothetical protein LINGRAPRIM_LOCUS394 [Linum grandiflorum]
MFFRSSTGKDIGFRLEGEDPWVPKRKGCWVTESSNLYPQPDEDATKFLVTAKQPVVGISSSSSDGGVRSLKLCADNQYDMFVASFKPQGTSSFGKCCPDEGRIRKGWKDNNSQGPKRKDLAPKDREKREAALNPISWKQFPDKGKRSDGVRFPGKRKREMDICNPVCKKRSDGVITKNEGGFCGGSKVRSAGQMGKNSTKNGYKEVAEKAGSIMRRPTGESKTSVRTTIKERKGPVPKRRKKSEAALDPLHCKMLPDKVQDVVQHIGSTKQPELGMNYQIVVKEEHPMCLGSDLDYTMDVIELDASMLPLGDSNPFVPADRLEVIDTEDVYDRAIMNPNSEFRLQLMEVLRQPYSDEEYNELLNEVSRPRQQPVNDEVPRPRSRRARPHPATSYLDQHKDFAKKLDEVQNHPEGNHHRREMLNLLRGFVYWLQHLLLYGAFEPWKDQLCLQELPR